VKWRLPRPRSGLAPEVEVVQAVPVPPHALQPQLRVYELHLRVGVRVSVCTNSTLGLGLGLACVRTPPWGGG
jgi:hypothetical protein